MTRAGVALAVALTLAWPVAAQRQIPNNVHVSGVVQIDDTMRLPLRGAIVTISAPELPRPRSLITDAAGTFVFAGLPPGRFTLTASKPPFLTMAYGSGRPGRTGMSIALAANEDVKDLVLRLPRGGVITGVLRDQYGAPIEGVTVGAVKTATSSARSLPSSSVTTDDRGVYRIFGLLPGDYVVAATFRTIGSGDMAAPSAAELDRRFAELDRARLPGVTGPAAAPPGTRPRETVPVATVALAPTFFPGTVNPADAAVVTVGSGEERVADFTVGPVRAGIVEGVVQTADGSPPRNVLISMNAVGPRLPANLSIGPTLSVRPTQTDGRFRFAGVTPGKYVLAATTEFSGALNGLFALLDLTSSGDDIAGLSLTLQPGLRLFGTVKFDGASAPPSDLRQLSISLAATRLLMGLTGSGLTLPTIASASPAADGSLTIHGLVPGPYYAAFANFGDWTLQSAVVNGKDALDEPFDVASDISGAVFTFTDRHTELSGTLRTASNAPATEFFVVAFPTDQSRWTAARRKQSTRPASDGVFTLKDLPAGEYYLAALTDVTADDLKDVSFLSQLVPGAIRVAIADGEKKTQDLKVGR